MNGPQNLIDEFVLVAKDRAIKKGIKKKLGDDKRLNLHT
jgi:hypothetical protein